MKSRVRKVVSVLALVYSVLVVGAGAALAQAGGDPTGGASGTFLADVKAWIIAQGGLIIAGLLFVGAAWALIVKFAKRGVKTI